MPDHCPTCGAAVRVRTADEGTAHFEVVADSDLAAAEAKIAEQRAYIDLLVKAGRRSEERATQLKEAINRELTAGKSGWHDRLQAAMEEAQGG